MNLKFVTTTDGSHTLLNSELNEHYHSVNGAVGESLHVFINTGLRYFEQTNLEIFEIGFGTGLNAFLTLKESIDKNINIHYHTIDSVPLSENVFTNLNYVEDKHSELGKLFVALHYAPWNETSQVTENFKIHKILADFNRYPIHFFFDLVYFDAFAPDIQPEMWSEPNFKKIFLSLRLNGCLVTYSSKGIVKTNLRNVGFDVKRLAGPANKRHILRATKNFE